MNDTIITAAPAVNTGTGTIGLSDKFSIVEDKFGKLESEMESVNKKFISIDDKIDNNYEFLYEKISHESDIIKRRYLEQDLQIKLLNLRCDDLKKAVIISLSIVSIDTFALLFTVLKLLGAI